MAAPGYTEHGLCVFVLWVKAKQATFTDITCPQMGRGEGSAE